jgi:death-on-curing family protein
LKKGIVIYQGKNGEISLKGDFKRETIWASLQQIADLFETDKSGISRHIKNIYQSGELKKKATVAKIATVQKEGKREVKREIEYYNLDLILSVGYRVNSKIATKFRQWATKTLREHILKGYTINKKRISKNYGEFLQAVETVKKLLPPGDAVKAEDALELVKMFADTWLSLDAYDKSALPKTGVDKKQVRVTAGELEAALSELKQNLIKKGQAAELFGQETQKDSVAGIMGNVFQSVIGKDAYETIEEKSAHLLYFFVKNHPFIDGNKRSGAFAFIWFLNKAGILRKDRISPEALTALTLFVAESNTKDKEKIIGLILLLLKK